MLILLSVLTMNIVLDLMHATVFLLFDGSGNVIIFGADMNSFGCGIGFDACLYGFIQGSSTKLIKRKDI